MILILSTVCDFFTNSLGMVSCSINCCSDTGFLAFPWRNSSISNTVRLTSSWSGCRNFFGETKNLSVHIGDIRNTETIKKCIYGCDTVIHLACISNDPSFDMNPELGKLINYDAFGPLVEISKRFGIKNFIYASSSSVYGIKTEKNVDETFTLEPLTDYSKFKADCEKILFEYQSDEFTTTVLRPATVCGFSLRQRFDLVVNILTNLAYNTRKITVFGGEQLRPNIHINDMVDAYIHILNAQKNKISGQIFYVL